MSHIERLSPWQGAHKHILLNVLLSEEKAMDNDVLEVLAFASALPGLTEDSGPRRGALMGAGSIFSQYIGRQQWVQNS